MSAVVIALLSVGCAPRSHASEVDQVGRLSHRQPLPDVLKRDPELIPPRETQELLQGTLTADDAARIALSSNRELRAMLREIGIAEGEYIQAGVLPNPLLELEMAPERESQMELRLEYDLTSALLAPKQAASKRPEVQAARFRAADTVLLTAARARIAYLEAQAARKRLSLANLVVDTFAAERDAAEALAQSGNVPAIELAERAAAYEQARLVVAELEIQDISARERLIRTLGVFGSDAAFTLAEELPDLPELAELPPALEAKALETSLALRASQAHLEALSKSTGYHRLAGALPDVAVDIHALRRNPNNQDVVSGQSEWRLGGGLSVALPLFDRRQGTVKSVESAYDAALERHVGFATDLRSEVRELGGHLLGAHHRALHLKRTVVPAQEELLKQTLLQYNAMQVGVFSLLSAHRKQLDMELSAIEAITDFWTARTKLDVLLQGGSIEVSNSLDQRTTFSQNDTGGH